MELENLEPATRIESLLDGEDIEPATRLEYFLKKAASGEGDGLPAYTTDDIGKVLGVVENGESSATVNWTSNIPPYIDFSTTLYYDDNDDLQSSFSVSDFVALDKAAGLCLVTDPDGFMNVRHYTVNRSVSTITGYFIWYGDIAAPLYYPTDNDYPITASVIAVDNNGVTINNYTLKADTTTGALKWGIVIK